METDVIINPEGGGRIIHRLKRTQRHAKCDLCQNDYVFLCDYLFTDGKTCDVKLCHGHRTRIVQLDYCPTHAAKEIP